MQIDECIKSRRSVRKYSDRDISNDTLSEIVDLARFSPSWKNTQVVRYHVIKNADIKEKIAQNCVLGFEFNAKTIVRCNALVIVSVVTKLSGYESDGSYSTSQGDRWEMFDAGIANQTFCLAAHSKGVGSVILGVFDENKIRQYLSLPENEQVTNLIALGYPLEAAKSAPPRKEVSELLEIID
jgi:nitroreductase